jgi:hypothetical protein
LAIVFSTDIWLRGSRLVASEAQAATGDGFEHITAGIGSIVTALAVVIGGIWAYFKFVRGRTYRPRLDVKMLGQWRLVDGRYLLHTRITLTNIGASVVTLQQRGGSGLRISLLSAQQPPPPSKAEWDVAGVFGILQEHQWIEAGETVSDDQLLDIGVTQPVMSLFEARLAWTWSGHKNEIVVMARQVVPPDSTMDGSTDVHRAPAQGEAVQK